VAVGHARGTVSQGEKETMATEKDAISIGETAACRNDIYWRRWRPDAREKIGHISMLDYYVLISSPKSLS
jgi:hypothetical protein